MSGLIDQYRKHEIAFDGQVLNKTWKHKKDISGIYPNAGTTWPTNIVSEI